MRLVRTTIAGICSGVLLFAAQPLGAQETQPVVYAAYYECDPAQVAGVDSILRTFWEPIIAKHITAGHMSAWGWLTHHTGAQWDRAFYMVAGDVDKALAALDGFTADANRANPAHARRLGSACPVHEDYIWRRVTGSQPAAQVATARPATGFSIYYQCSPAREQRADAIVTSTIAPIMNGLVKSGDLNSWTWFEHIVGGKYRRLLATDGRDPGTVIGAIGKVSGELRSKHAAQFEEFSQICHSHQDNVWGITIARP